MTQEKTLTKFGGSIALLRHRKISGPSDRPSPDVTTPVVKLATI
jgi:hypothetical protein